MVSASASALLDLPPRAVEGLVARAEAVFLAPTQLLQILLAWSRHGIKGGAEAWLKVQRPRIASSAVQMLAQAENGKYLQRIVRENI